MANSLLTWPANALETRTYLQTKPHPKRIGQSLNACLARKRPSLAQRTQKYKVTLVSLQIWTKSGQPKGEHVGCFCSVFLFFFLSFFLSFLPSFFIPFPAFLPAFLRLPFSLSICFCRSFLLVCTCVHVCARLSVCPSVGLWVCASVCLSACASVRLSVCPSVRLWVCASVCLCVCVHVGKPVSVREYPCLRLCASLNVSMLRLGQTLAFEPLCKEMLHGIAKCKCFLH